MGTWLGATLLAAAVGGLAYWRRALTLDGALGATAVGALVFRRGGLPAASALLAFFVSSSALSRLQEARKTSGSLAQAKGARRDAGQVLANGGVAALALAVGRPGGCLGALATANADTWATELGMLSRRRPRLITTLAVVEPGTSGGVTAAGLLASLAGASLVGAAWAISAGSVAAWRVGLVAGLLGSIVDSLLGATLQALYQCPVCGQRTERAVHPGCGQRGVRLRGVEWIDNDVVNALATLSGALLGGLLWRGNRARRST
jgi:uncharacterized protein (TIGR00297 family)